MRVLVVGAHPDDEILGCGGTITKHSFLGDEVFVCIATKAYPPEWTEEYHNKKVIAQKKVDEYLGIKKRFNLDFPTVTLNTIPHGQLNKAVQKVFNEVKPDVCYTHYQHDTNLDHQLVFNACLLATRPPKLIDTYCYEVPSVEWDEVAFHPNNYVLLSKAQIEKKLEAMRFYDTEVKNPPHPRSIEGIFKRAEMRGIEICTNYAEAFVQIRGYK